jgi:hypothetical protein
MTRRLLPYEHDLAATLGVTEEEYVEFLSIQETYNDPKEGTVLDIRNMPPAAPVVAGAAVAGTAAATTAATLAFISTALTVVGIIFQVAAVLLAEKPSAPKAGRNQRDKRFSPRFGFNSAQELAQYGDTVNLVYCNTSQNSQGAVRVAASLVWSSVEGTGSSQFMQLLMVLGAARILQLDHARTAFGQLPLGQFSGSNVWLYYQSNGNVRYNNRVLGDGKDPTRDGAAGTANVCRINDKRDGFSQAFSPTSLTSIGVYDPIPVNVEIQERDQSGKAEWTALGVTIASNNWPTGNNNRFDPGESFTLIFRQARKRQSKISQEAAKDLRYQLVESLDQAATYMLGTALFRLVSIEPGNANLDRNDVRAKFECIQAGRRPAAPYNETTANAFNKDDLKRLEDFAEQLDAKATNATITAPDTIRRGKPQLFDRVRDVTDLDDYKFTVTYGRTAQGANDNGRNPFATGGDSVSGGDLRFDLRPFGGKNYNFTGNETVRWETDLDARDNPNRARFRSALIPRGGSIAVTKKVLRSWLSSKPKLDVQALRREYNDDLEKARQLIDDINSGDYDRTLRKQARRNSRLVSKLRNDIKTKKQRLENRIEKASDLKKNSKRISGDRYLLERGTNTNSKEARGIAGLEKEIEDLRDDISDVLSGDVAKIKIVYIKILRDSTSSFRGIDGNIYAGGIRELKRKLARLKGQSITDQDGVRAVRQYLNQLIQDKEDAFNLAEEVSKNWERWQGTGDNNFYTKCLVKAEYAAYQTITACNFVKFSIAAKVFRRISGRAKKYGKKNAPDGYKSNDNGMTGRIAFFTMSYRKVGSNSYTRVPIVFAFRRASDQDNFIALNFKTAQQAKWEFRFDPIGDIGAELNENNQRQFAFIANGGGGSSLDLPGGAKIRWTGRLVDRKDALLERGPIDTNEWDLFSVRSDTQTQFSFDNGPEFRITAVTEQQVGSIAGKYDNMSMMALGVYSGKGVQDLRSITAYVKEGKNSYVVNDNGTFTRTNNSTSYASDIFADTVLDRENGIGKYAKPEGIDWNGLALSKRFCKNNGLGTQLFMDGVIADLSSWRQFWVENAPFSLLEFARVGGKETLIPAIPTNNSGRANREVNISALFTTGNILEGSYKEEFIDYGDSTQDIIATVIYRETETQDVFPRNASVQVKLRDVNEGNAIRQTFDASQFVTRREQAILFGKLICNQRRHIRRGVEFQTFPTDSPISPGAYIYVDIGMQTWDRITSGIIMEGGALNAPLTDRIANGSYSVLTYRNDQAARSFTNVTITNGVAASLANRAGSMFVLGAQSNRKRVFRVTEVQMDEEGEVTVKAVEHPCVESGGKLLSRIADFAPSLFRVT